jgi:hypothetical protein
MRRTAPPVSDVRTGEGASTAHPTAKDAPEPRTAPSLPVATAVTAGGRAGPETPGVAVVEHKP